MEFRFACEVCSSINPQLSTINQSELPRGVIRSAPVSDTGGPGAKPGEAANFRAPFPTTNKHLIARSAMAVCKHFMSDILNKTIVLVLNRNWQAINIRTPAE